MGDVLQIRDYQLKRGIKPVETPLKTGLSIIAHAMSEVGSGIDGLAWPGMDVQAPYMAPDKDPA